MPADQPRILLAGGGTGGHLFPALAIADELRNLRPAAQFLFIGTKEKIEARVVPQKGYSFASIWISGFHRGCRPGNLIFPLKVMVSLVQSFFLIRRYRPDVVIGTGGYVCGPVLYVASLLGIPMVLHESNSYPGITTRMLAGRAQIVFTAFEATKRWLRRTDNIVAVGTPTRMNLGTSRREDAAKAFGLDPAKRTVLVFGGSLGSASINRAVQESLVAAAKHEGFQLIWQTGRTDVGPVEEARTVGWVGTFIDAMDQAYAAADLVVCRAGATTLAEITRIGKPAILIPFPYAAADHQTVNAQTLVDAGAAVLIKDKEVGSKLAGEVQSLLADDRRREAMHAASLALGRPGAGRVMAERILRLIV